MKSRIIIFIISFIIVGASIFFVMNKSSKELNIKVKTNGGVPFTWEYSISDTSIVEFVKKENHIKEKYKNLSGGQVDVIYTFKGLKEGKTTITLKYVHISEEYVSETKVYNVKVDKNKNISLY